MRQSNTDGNVIVMPACCEHGWCKGSTACWHGYVVRPCGDRDHTHEIVTLRVQTAILPWWLRKQEITL